MSVESLGRWARRWHARGWHSPVGIAFHWAMAALVTFQLGWGWWVARMDVGADKLLGQQRHVEVGLVVLVLGAARLVWRKLAPPPKTDGDTDDLPGWLAKATYAVFYASFFALPVSGWAMWSVLPNGLELSLAGLVPWPALPLEALPPQLQMTVLHVAAAVHVSFIVALTVLVPLHTGAALYHHFVRKDDVLEAMAPGISETPVVTPPPEPQPDPASAALPAAALRGTP